MKQILGLLVLAVLVTSLATAQFGPAKGKMTLGPAIEAALPIGDFGDISSFGVGGTARFEYGLEPKIALTANAGYIWFSGKEVSADYGTGEYSIDYSISAIPLIAGLKYQFAPQFFVSGELGFWFTSTSTEAKGFTSPIPGITGDVDDSDTNFMFAPGVGYQNGPIEALIRFWVVDSDASNLSLMIAYNLPIN